MKKEINFQHILFFLYIFLLLFPENSGSLIPSLPIDNFYEIIVLIISIYAGFKIIKQRNILLYSIFVIFIIKLIFLLQPSNLWELCYQDNIAPRAPEEINQTRDYDFSCEKIYQFNTLENTTLVKEINFVSDPESEWLGANASNFHLGFFNSKKFNHRGDGNLSRKWLPFELSITKKIEQDIEDLNLIFLGEIYVYKNTDLIYSGKNYETNEITTIENLSDSSLKILYKFNKKEAVKINSTFSKNYPPDRYGMIQVYNKDMEYLSSDKTNLTKFLEAIFILLMLFLIYSLIKNSTKNYFSFYLQSRKLFIISLAIMFYFIVNSDGLSVFPVFGILDSFTIFMYLAIFSLFYFYKLSPIEILIVCFVGTYLLLDIDFKIYNEYLRPGGSDSLTYEYFSRLVLEGNFFEGGESIYSYSPGARYFLYFLHILFGEKLKIIFIVLNAVAAFYAVIDKEFKLDSKNIFSYLTFVYLTSNAINRIFLFGMSEIFSLVLILIYLKTDSLKSKYPYISGVILGLIMFNRVILVLGVLALVALSKNLKTFLGFLTIGLIPFVHNLYYGNQVLLLTNDWNYQGEVVGEGYNLLTFIEEIVINIQRNFNYVIMNPFSEEIYNRVGRLLPIIFSVSVLAFIYLIIKKKNSILNSQYLLNLVPIILVIAPFAIYDPRFFYPRFLLVPHIMFLIYCQNLKNEFS